MLPSTMVAVQICAFRGLWSRARARTRGQARVRAKTLGRSIERAKTSSAGEDIGRGRRHRALPSTGAPDRSHTSQDNDRTFKSEKLRDSVYNGREQLKTFNKTKEPAQRVYINEDLTKRRSLIAWFAEDSCFRRRTKNPPLPQCAYY